MSRPQKFLF
jgi:hypothetical protein